LHAVQYPSFYSQNGFDVGSAITSLRNISIAFLSSPEVVFLKDARRNLANTTLFVLKFRNKNDTEPSTKQSYGSLLSNLTSISSYASGILVPKDYIWSVNNESGLLVSESTLISDAHTANLAIYAYDFVNELMKPSIYNYSFNPILEYLQYAPSIGPNVDGFFTDFPLTASKALGK
jgi:glycerophosphoryl diester phosphodiesterase